MGGDVTDLSPPFALDWSEEWGFLLNLICALKGSSTSNQRKRAQGKNNISKGHIKGYLGGRKNIPNEDLERQIVVHIKSFESRFFGLTTKDVRKLAYQLAERNSLTCNFNRIKEEPDWEWLSYFRNRNPDISLRLLKSTSLARAMGFNKPQMTNYFNKLSDKVNFNPTKIWNMDERGLLTILSRNSKIFAAKGKNLWRFYLAQRDGNT
ncbi:hypothetical protein NQ317_013344 [Molorchus minor]|uniref:HTH CENPB-type domain-containing protein n=1 Tax=Molorchus minor TaxID=1323400 RepID=A0ABQ9ITW1_9CUCU|nr:hypothetical protein NQ317_013344 [Molorchus minor]